jgi:hypothetical protein
MLLPIVRGKFCATCLTLLLLFAAVCAGDRTHAATLYALDYETYNYPQNLSFNPVCNAKLDGEIRAGDYDKISEKVARFENDPRDRRSFFFAVCLSGSHHPLRRPSSI